METLVYIIHPVVCTFIKANSYIPKNMNSEKIWCFPKKVCFKTKIIKENNSENCTVKEYTNCKKLLSLAAKAKYEFLLFSLNQSADICNLSRSRTIETDSSFASSATSKGLELANIRLLQWFLQISSENLAKSSIKLSAPSLSSVLQDRGAKKFGDRIYHLLSAYRK